MIDVGEALPALLAFLAALFLIALSKAYDYSLGALLQLLVAALGGVAIPLGFTTLHPLKFIADGIDALDNAIRQSIGLGIETFQGAAAQWFQWFAYSMERLGAIEAEVAGSVEQAIQRILKVSIGAIIASKLANLIRELHTTTTVTKTVTKTIPAKVAAATKLAITFPVTVERVTGLPKLVKAAVASAIAAAGIPVAVPRTGDLLHGIDDLRARLDKLTQKLSLGAIVGIGAYALTQLGLGDSNCSNAKKWNKGMCGVNPSVIENFLTDALLIASTISIVELARESQAFVADVEAPLKLFVRELRDLNLTRAPSYSAELAAYAAGRF